MPGRTQSLAMPGQPRMAGESCARLTSACRPYARLFETPVDLAALGRSSSSARAKWLISTIFSTLPLASRRAWASRYSAGCRTDPVHAGIQLQPDLQRSRCCGALDRPTCQVAWATHSWCWSIRPSSLSSKNPEQQDRLMDAGIAQLQRFLDAGHGEPVGLAFQGGGAARGAMPVGVGLGPPRKRPGTADLAGEAVSVRAQGFEVRSGHGRDAWRLFLTVKKPAGPCRAKGMFRFARRRPSSHQHARVIQLGLDARAGQRPSATQASYTSLRPA